MREVEPSPPRSVPREKENLKEQIPQLLLHFFGRSGIESFQSLVAFLEQERLDRVGGLLAIPGALLSEFLDQGVQLPKRVGHRGIITGDPGGRPGRRTGLAGEEPRQPRPIAAGELRPANVSGSSGSPRAGVSRL